MDQESPHPLILAFPDTRPLVDQIMVELASLGDNRFSAGDSGSSSFADKMPTSDLPNVRDRKVYLVAGMQHPHPMICFGQILEVLDALEGADVGNVTLVVPYLTGSRSDRKAKGRESILAKRIAIIFETYSRLRRMVTFDLHSPQIQGFYQRICVTHLTGSLIFAEHARPWTHDPNDPLIIVSPDTGALKRTEELKNFVGGHAMLGTLHKTRPNNNESQVSPLGYMGEPVEGRRVVIPDDIIDTGGTISHAATFVRSLGAREVIIMATHGILSTHKGKSAEEQLRASGARVIISDSIPRSPSYLAEREDFLRVVSNARLLARAIHETSNPDGSVSRIYEEARAAAKHH